MKPDEPVEMEPDDGAYNEEMNKLLKEEIEAGRMEDYNTWLDEVEKEKLKNLDFHMKQIEKQFKQIFNKPI